MTASKFYLYGFFKHNKFFLHVQPCITLIMIVCTLVLLHHTTTYSGLTYQRYLEINSNVSFQLQAVDHSCNNKEHAFGNKANQIVERSDHANKNASFNQSKYELHKIQQLHTKSKQTNNKPDQKDINTKGQQPVCTKVENLTNARDTGINATHICGILMEPVNINYTRNIYFTVKTTYKYYTNRLLLLMLTWLQTVDKDKVSIVTDKSAEKQTYIDMIRKSGFHIIDTSCPAQYKNDALCCKLSYEFAEYYKIVEKHPDAKDEYQWFCHIDDDVQVNILELSQYLQQHDPQKPYYIGKWPKSARKDHLNVPLKTLKMDRFIRRTKYTLHYNTSYQYATGATYCISYTLMMKAKKFFQPKTFRMIAKEAQTFADDMTVGFIIHALLGYNLTDATILTNQYDTYVKTSSLKEIIKYPTVSSVITENDHLKKLAALLKLPLSPEPKMSILYHCLLYPTVTWCEGIREVINGIQL